MTSESRYIHADRPEDDFKLMLPRKQVGSRMRASFECVYMRSDSVHVRCAVSAFEGTDYVDFVWTLHFAFCISYFALCLDNMYGMG